MSAFTPEFIALQSAVAGRFSLERELGRGGMGIVFLARDVLLERHVAIKLLAPALAAHPEMRRRFLREARIAAQCFHPHIVPIHTVEERDGLAFFVMAHVRGETLAERLARSGTLRPEQVARIGREVGWALSYAHERGVIHRDVKPSNILLEEGSGRALIADFGIALHDDPSASARRTPTTGTPTPDVAGTARFMAPEQALGETVDGRADLYALGVTLYLASTGKYPHDGANALAVLAQQTRAHAAPVRTHARALPPALADAIDRCLARDPEARFAHAAEFVAALETPAEATSPALLPVQSLVAQARGLAGWTVATALTTALVVQGESSFGAAIFGSIGWSFTLALGALTAERIGQALYRAPLERGSDASGESVARALAGDEPRANAVDETPVAARTRAALLLVVGVIVALGQGAALDVLVDLPDLVGTMVQLAAIVAPLLLVRRGIRGLVRASRIGAALRERVALPLARWYVRTRGVPVEPRVVVESAPTELRLDRAAESILARLSPDARRELSALPAAIDALAAEARALRARDTRLLDEERRAREGGADVDPGLVDERARVQGRLSTAIAALESVRLDLLRLEQGEITADGLTTHLDAVRALQRQVDARREVDALLHDRDTTPV